MAGICTDDPQERKTIGSELRRMHFHPVFLSEAEIENYYEGYSNSTIWPLCHYFYAYTLYKSRFWEAYREVNRRFCEEICRVVEPGDRVWVQDYHLMLLPGMLREAMPDLCIGYFHHIPFPSYELFRILPERARLLRGLLGADFIAFHTPDYMRHFVSAAQHILNVEFRLDEAQLGSRTARVDALPMGINYDLYHKAASKIQVRDAVEKYRRLFGDRKLILSVDRLDYSKGILHRLHGFASFLERHPEYRGQSDSLHGDRPFARPCGQLCRTEDPNRRGDRLHQRQILHDGLDSGMLFLSRILVRGARRHVLRGGRGARHPAARRDESGSQRVYRRQGRPTPES